MPTIVQEIRVHYHPSNSKAGIMGVRLQAGDVIREDDYYSSASGKWEYAPIGLVIPKNSEFVWVRKMPS